MGKLVRDKIPEIIRRHNNREPVTRTLDASEYYLELKRKVAEELAEFQADDNFEELADNLEIIFAVADYHLLDRTQIQKTAEQESLDSPMSRDQLYTDLANLIGSYLLTENANLIFDIVCCIYEIARFKQITPEQLEEIRLHKFDERGGFVERVYLES
jgi:predicted house-cleaning noncanonical NTP pyrophosphatase (MazG superfamily)